MALKDVTLHSIAAAERFVERSRLASWDGWTIVVHVPNPRAYMHPRGVYDRATEKWGFKYSYPVDSNGKWTVKVFDRGSK